MTTDTKIKPKTESEKLFADLDKPSLHALSYALRHPDTWPENFVWDYNDCQQCAMGLANAFWHKGRHQKSGKNTEGYEFERPYISRAAKDFGIPYGKAVEIFFDSKTITTTELHRSYFGLGPNVPHQTLTKVEEKDVTPEMVADQIDKYLETVE